MKKFKSIFFSEQFWLYFIGGAVGIFILEIFFLGMWALPVINYSIPYMNEVTLLDMLFVIAYAISFAFGLSVFLLQRKFNSATCAVGTGSGILAFFTMLCPVCPVFFLAYFGLSATIMSFGPYFWWFRLVSFIMLGIGIFLLWKKYEINEFPKMNLQLLLQKIGIVAVFMLLVLNQSLAIRLGQSMIGADSESAVTFSGDFAKDVAALVVPTTLPFYGKELGLDMSSLNAINKSISKLSVMAPKQGSKPIELNEEEMRRYIKIGTEPYVTCEFCCGVKTLVDEDGSPTCGCAHSIAMRGTTAYLIRNYPEMSDAEISYELMRQKGMYFPGQMQERMASSLAGDINEATADIKYLTMHLSEKELSDFKEKANDSGFKPVATPDMVGGC